MSTGANSREGPSALEWYRLVRSRIEHEDNLMVQRLSWMVASQSFLFTAYAVTANGLSTSGPKVGGAFGGQQVLLLHLIPVVGICAALLIYASIVAALRAIRELRKLYYRRLSGHELLPLQSRAPMRWLGVSAPFVLPLLFAAVWWLLLVHGGG